jgi:serine protease AprX
MRKMKIASLVACLVIASTSTGFALTKPTVQKGTPEYKIQRVAGSKIMSNLANKTSEDKLPVIVTFNTMDGAKKFNKKFKRKYRNIPAVATEMTMAEVHELAKHPDVAQIDYDEQVRVMDDGSDYWYGTAKARADFGVDGDGDGNISSFTKADNTIAVIDTGIDASHVDLQNKVIGWYDATSAAKTTPYDDNGHGTHVAGIAAGKGVGNAAYKGVAPGASLVGIKVLSGSGSGSTSDVIEGIDWAIANKDKYGIKVINMSLGSSGSSDGKDASSLAVNRAVDAGIVTAVAAGNSGPATKTVGSPGAAAKALTVGAMADPSEGGFNLAYFSSRGTTADGRIKPDIAAPGYNIMAARANSGNGYVSLSGTSMATPFVAGVASLILDANPSLAPVQVQQKMESTADNWGPAGKDVDYGSGNLKAYDAIKSAGGFTGTGPTLPQHIYKEGTISTTRGKQDHVFSFKAGQKVAITMIIPQWSSSLPDLDVYLLNSSGSTMAYAIGTKRQETITYTIPTTGTYTVSVRSYLGTGNYFFDLSA